MCDPTAAVAQRVMLRVTCPDSPGRAFLYAARLVAMTPGAHFMSARGDEEDGHAVVAIPPKVQNQLLCGAAMRCLPVPPIWGRVIVSALSPSSITFGHENEFSKIKSTGDDKNKVFIHSLDFEKARELATAEATATGVADHDPTVDVVGPATAVVRQLFPDIPTLQAELEDEIVRYIDAVASVDPTMRTRVEEPDDISKSAEQEMTSQSNAEPGGHTSGAPQRRRNVADVFRRLLLVASGDLCSSCRPFEVEGHEMLPVGYDTAVTLTPCEEGRVVLHTHELRPAGTHKPLQIPRFVKLCRDNFEATHRDLLRSFVAAKLEDSGNNSTPTTQNRSNVAKNAAATNPGEVDDANQSYERVLVCTNNDENAAVRFMPCEGELACVDTADGETLFMYRASLRSPKHAVLAEQKRLRKLEARGGDIDAVAKKVAMLTRFTERFESEVGKPIVDTPHGDVSYHRAARCLEPSVPTRWSTMNKLVRYIIAPLLLSFDTTNGSPCRCEISAVGHAATLFCHVVLELMGRSWSVRAGSDAVPTAAEAATLDFINSSPDDETAKHPMEENDVTVHAGLLEKLLSTLNEIADHQIFFFEEDVLLCDHTLTVARPGHARKRRAGFWFSTPTDGCSWPPTEGAFCSALESCLELHGRGYDVDADSHATIVQITKALQLTLLELAITNEKDRQTAALRVAALCYGGRRDGTPLTLDDFAHRLDQDLRRVMPFLPPLFHKSALLEVHDFRSTVGSFAAKTNAPLLELLPKAQLRSPLVDLYLRLVRETEQPPARFQGIESFRSRSQDLISWAAGVDTRPRFPPAPTDLVQYKRHVCDALAPAGITAELSSAELSTDFANGPPTGFLSRLSEKSGAVCRSLEVERFVNQLAPRPPETPLPLGEAYETLVATRLLRSADVAALIRYREHYLRCAASDEAPSPGMHALMWTSSCLLALSGLKQPQTLWGKGHTLETMRVMKPSDIPKLTEILFTSATAATVGPDSDCVLVSAPSTWLTGELVAYHLMSEGYYNLAALAFTSRTVGYFTSQLTVECLRCQLASAYCRLVALGEGIRGIAVAEARAPAFCAVTNAYSTMDDFNASPDSRSKSHYFETLRALENAVSVDVNRAIEYMYSPFVDPLPDAPVGGSVPATFMELHAAAVAEVQHLPQYTEFLLILAVVVDKETAIRTRVELVNEDLWLALPRATRTNAEKVGFIARVSLKLSSIEPAVARLLFALCSSVFVATHAMGTQVLLASRHKPDWELVARYPPDPDAPLPPSLRDLSVDGLKSKGNHAFAQGKKALAIASYHGALTKLADSGLDNALASVLCSNLSLAYLAIRDANGAHLMAAAAMELAPTQPKPWLRAVQAALAFPFRHPPSIAAAAAGWALLKIDPPIPRDSVLDAAVAGASALGQQPLRSKPVSEDSKTPLLHEIDRIVSVVATGPVHAATALRSQPETQKTLSESATTYLWSNPCDRVLDAAAARHGVSHPCHMRWVTPPEEHKKAAAISAKSITTTKNN